MKKKVLLLLIVCMVFLCLTGCIKNKGDTVQVFNRDITVYDDIYIDIKEGYFYDSHAKFVVDENTVCVAILFTNNSDAEWKELEK